MTQPPQERGMALSRRDSSMMLRYQMLFCFVAVFVVVGLRTPASAVPVQTTYSYVGADYTYQPAGQFTYNGNPYPLPGTGYAAILDPRLTASVVLHGDTSNATVFYDTNHLGNPDWLLRRLRVFVRFGDGGVRLAGLLICVKPYIVKWRCDG